MRVARDWSRSSNLVASGWFSLPSRNHVVSSRHPPHPPGTPLAVPPCRPERQFADRRATSAATPTAPPVVDVTTFGARCRRTGSRTTPPRSNQRPNLAGGKTLSFPAGTCMVSGVRLSDATTVSGIGPSSVVKLRAAALGDDKPVFEAGNDVTIQNVKIDGNRAAQPGHRFSDSYNDAGGNSRDACFSCGAGHELLGRGPRRDEHPTHRPRHRDHRHIRRCRSRRTTRRA